MSHRTCLSYWFPKLEAAGVPVPKTEIVTMPPELRDTFGRAVFDGNPLSVAASDWISQLEAACRRMGSPCFLRTGQTSGKHEWKNTCYVTDAAKTADHVFALINFSECCDFLGLPWDVWCVREYLPVVMAGDAGHVFCRFDGQIILEDYGNMPARKEVRSFIRDGEIICVHPYWPKESLLQGMVIPASQAGQPLRRLLSLVDDAYESLCDFGDDWRPTVEKVAEAFSGDGAWSVDVLWTDRGWMVTDMAEAARSFHWEGCPLAERLNEESP